MKSLDSPADASLDREIVARGRLYDFVKMAWPHCGEPSEFVPGWHLEEICLHLEAVSRGECRRLVINQPPGTGKSLLVSVFWPSWEWLHRPATKWIYASYDQSLVCRDAAKQVSLVQSDFYRARWPHVRLREARPAASDYSNTAGGSRFSTSVRGKVTGRHADIQVVDDPIKPKDAMGGGSVTKAELKFVSDWWAHTMATRLSDPKTSRRVIVMQRLNVDDLAGECIAAGYTLLRLPMRYEASDPCRTSHGGDRRTEDGELLCPSRMAQEEVSQLETDLGPDVAASQLQQRPALQGGGIFREAYLRYYDELPATGLWVQSWDMTFGSIKASADFVCGQVWLVSAGAYYLVDQVHARMQLPDMLAAVRELSAAYPRAHDKLIEDKANGMAVEQMLRQSLSGVTLVTPMGGKEARANATTPLWADGKIFLPRPTAKPWINAYTKQLLAFPRSIHDDMVDATTQALIQLRRHGDSFARAMAKLRGEK